jgi:hypothetical protein
MTRQDLEALVEELVGPFQEDTDQRGEYSTRYFREWIFPTGPVVSANCEVTLTNWGNEDVDAFRVNRYMPHVCGYAEWHSYEPVMKLKDMLLHICL